MKLLWLVPRFPYPPNQGIHRVNYNRIATMANHGHDIYLLSGVDEKPNKSSIKHMEGICEDVVWYEHRSSSRDKILDLFTDPVTPNCFSRMITSEAEVYVESLADEVDAIITEQPFMSELTTSVDTTTILSEHNIEYHVKLSCSRAAFPNSLIESGWNLVEGIRTRYCERKLLSEKEFEGYIFLSEREYEFATSRFPIADESHFSPIGIDTQRFQIQSSQSGGFVDGPALVFVGYMGYPPNVDAVTWFANEVLPDIREIVQDVTFYIVGKKPSESVRNLDKRDGIVVTGAVDEVEPYLQHATVAVIPIREGGGVKVKLLEALASRTPTVSTSKGIEGTAVEPGDQVLVADGKHEFTSKVAKLLSSQKQRIRLGESGHEYVCDVHDWDAICEHLENFIQRLA